MIEQSIEIGTARPPIPAIIRLRRKYGAHYGCIRSQTAMSKMRREKRGEIKRPSMGDRMEASAEKQWRKKQNELERMEEKLEYIAHERQAAKNRKLWESVQDYKGVQGPRRKPGT